VILEDGKVIDSMLYSIAQSMQEFGKQLFSSGTYDWNCLWKVTFLSIQ